MIDSILSRASEGERITAEEAVALYEQAPLEDLGAAAEAVARRMHGDEVTYNVNGYLNPTNICVVGCGFCAFAVWTDHDPRAYAYSVDQLVDRAQEISALGITEVEFIARMAKVTPREALERLIAAGHDSMPGGGAEVFSPRVRKIIADRKLPAEEWIEVHRDAHALGLPTNATLLFGHFETPEEKVEHMVRLRQLQEDGINAGSPARFQAFIPLPFLPGNTDFSYLPGPSREEKLRTIAVSRLVLDNFPHIKGHWVMLEEDVTQEALAYGLDDLSGTLVEERVAHATTVQTPMGLTRDRIGDLIRGGGRIPVERNTTYGRVDREAISA